VRRRRSARQRRSFMLLFDVAGHAGRDFSGIIEWLRASSAKS
jgi:hypothetical protein